ncbi:MAG: nucleotidyltransferase family protein [Leptolyngbyaceae cyanobacterium CRU_2_3]|nr:nucleotidyltransferase family protein [Leptolyngbyaceae cyanobacterium CRU_2_3]
MNIEPDFPNFAIILAAGASSRMGKCKTSLPWLDNQTMLCYQVSQWLKASVTPVVVLSPHNADRRFEMPPGTWAVVNPEPSRGKTSSLLIGLQAIPQAAETIAIAAVDQPRSAEIYQTLLHSHQQHYSLITAPVHGDRLGHPLLFSRAMRSELETVSEASQGIRHLIKHYFSTINQVQFPTPIVLSDLNTPEAYQSQLDLSSA